MNNEPTSLDIAKARRAVDEAMAPTFSLADELKCARERRKQEGNRRSDLLDPATRPDDPKGQALWDRIQAAKERMRDYCPATAPTRHQPAAPDTEAEIEARIAEIRARRGR